MFFRSLSVLATIACATFAAAIPVGVSDLTKAAGGVALPNIKTPTIRRASGELKVVVAGKDITVPIGTRDVSKTVEHPSLPEVFSLAVQKLGPVNDKLKQVFAVKAEISLEAVAGLLEEVEDILEDTCSSIGYIVEHITENPTGFVFSLAGEIIDLPALAVLIATLIKLVCGILTLVAGVTGIATATIIAPICIHIGALLATVVGLALRLVPAVLPLLLEVVASLLSTISALKLTELAIVLRLPTVA